MLRRKINKKILIWWLFIIFIIWIKSLWAFNTGFSRNNDNFLDKSFWNANPSTEDIITAVFGDGTIGNDKTAYTRWWTGYCATGNIGVQYIKNYDISGSNSIPAWLTGNTIYVLDPGRYITSTYITFSWSCTAILGRWTTTLYTDQRLYTGTLRTNGKNNLIIDNIRVDWLKDGLGGIRAGGDIASGNQYGIYLYSSRNDTIHHVQAYNNRYGIEIDSTNNATVSDSISHDNAFDAIATYTSTRVNIINSMAFNDRYSSLITLSKSFYCTIQNSQAFNGALYGIIIDSGGNNLIMNTQSYNNLRAGLQIKGGSINNTIYNSQFYNNSTYGVLGAGGNTGNKYYGNIKIFGNNTGLAAYNDFSTTGFSAGLPTDTTVSGLNRATGTLDNTGFMWYNYITNATTEQGALLITGTAWTTADRWKKEYSGQEFVSFSYGTGIFFQIQPVIYTGTNLIPFTLPYTSNKYNGQVDVFNQDPDWFSFSAITWATTNQLYTSNIITLTGIYSGITTPLSMSWRWFIYKNGISIGTGGTGTNGDQLYIAITGSASYYTMRIGTLFAGASRGNFSVTTQQDPNTSNSPSQFTFTSITWANPNQLYTSNIITFTGISNGVVVTGTLNGTGILYKNGINIGTSGTGINGDKFYIAITGSTNYLTTISTTLTAGATSGSFAVTTRQDTTPPTFTGVVSWSIYSGQVTIYFSDDNLSWATLNGNTYLSWTSMTGEWIYTFIVSDTAGNSTGATFTINYPKQIIITFDQNISTGIVSKAPIKYNKDVAYSRVIDDGLIGWYQPGFEYLNGWIVSWRNTNFVAPGLYYTDGAGNDIAFRWGYAWYSVNSQFSDIHLTTPSYLTWTQLRETYLNGWDVLNHWWTSSAYPTSGQLFAYPDTPPGTTGLDYTYELNKNNQAVRDNIGIPGVMLTHVILPSGDTWYVQPARNLGYKTTSSQGLGTWALGINIYNNLNLYQLQFNRTYYVDNNFTTGTMITDIDDLMSRTSPTSKLWRNSFSHGILLTGNLNGNISRTNRQYLMDHIEDTYGKKWSDRIRFAWPQEIYEYVASKQETDLNTIISGNQLIVNLNSSSLENNLRRKALTLLISWTNANITNIQYTGLITYHSENTWNGLINIERWDYYLTDRNPNPFSLANLTGTIRNQLYTSNIITLSGMSSGLNNIIYLSGDTSSLYKNWVSIGTGGTGANRDQFYIAMTGSTNYADIRSTQLIIGPQSSTFSLLTQSDVDPDQFLFTPIQDATPNQLYTSDTITLSGMTNGIQNTVLLSGWGTLYKNGINIGTNGTGANGDQFYAIMNASANYYTTRIGTITIGATSWIFSVTTLQDAIPAYNRNNDSFIDKSFRNNNPSTGAIINAVYGDGNGTGAGGTDTTAYTNFRTGNCNIWQMNVVNIANFDDSGMNSLPLGLSANTIYVLNPGKYVTSGVINFGGNCIAVIGKGDVYLYSSGSTPITGTTLQISNRKGIIIDNIKINGLNNALTYGSGHNDAGIYFFTILNGTIHKVQSFNNKTNIMISNSNNVATIDSLAYNSTLYGYEMYGAATGSKNYLINSQIFNNSSIWVYVGNSYGFIMNNIQSYNNGFNGISISAAANTIINNSQVYNNLRYGARIDSNSPNTIINNTQFYNNSSQWIWATTGSSWTYYGTLKMFNNQNANTISGWGIFIAGNATDSAISGSNRSTGIIDTNGSIGYPYITNPKDNSRQYLISGNNRSSTNRGNRTTSGSIFIDFTYGTGIFSQTRNIMSTSQWISTLSIWSFNANNYIWQVEPITKDPDGFVFISTTWAEINQLYTSNTITLTGMANNTINTVILTGRGTLYKNGTNIGNSGTGTNGDMFFITMNSSSNYYTIRYGVLSVGVATSTFSVTTKHDPFYNDIPLPFTFNDTTWAVPNQLYTSNIITITGMSNNAVDTVLANGNTNSIYKNGINIGTSGTGANGDQFYIAMNASNYYTSTLTWWLTVGTIGGTRSLTTMDQPTTDPNPFIFNAISWANPNQLYTSNIITFSGMSDGIIANIGVSGNAIIYKNGVNIGTGGTGTNGNQFYLAMNASPNYISSIQSTLIAGNTSAVFSVTTKQDTTPPIFTWATSGTNSSWTVTITYRDDNLSGATLNGNPYSSGTPITWEGNYSFMTYDTAGNSTGANFSIIYPKTLIITFQNPISTGIVTKAPLKYNKDVALSFSQDDGYGNAYEALYRYFNGGLVSWRNTNFIAPGLYSTDGAGNDIPFRGSLAWFSVSWIYQPPIQIHNSAGYWMSRDQLRETYINWRDIMNHGWQSAAYPTSWQQFIYPDNPPGTTGLDYTYELQKNIQVINNSIGLSWVIITQENNPSGDSGYVQPARNLWYRAIMGHPGGSTIRSYNVYNYLDPYQLLIPRQYYTDDNFPTTGSVVQDLDGMMASASSSPTIKTRKSYFNHGEDFTGFDSNWLANGALKFSTFKYLADDMASYGKKWTDNIRVAGDQDVYEYIASKEQTNLSSTISWNQMVVTLDIANLYNDLRRKSLTLLVSGTNSPIQSIQYQSGAFSFHSENTGNGLINIEWWEYIPGDRDPNTFNISPITWALRNQVYTSNMVTITGMSPGLDNIIYLSGDSTAKLYKNGTNIGTSGTGANGDQFAIAMTGSNSYTTTKTSQLLIGPESSTFTLLTQDDADPDQFSFSPVQDANINQLYTSNIITLAGMTTWIQNTVTLSGWGTLYKNGVNIGTSGTGTNGDQLYITMNSSSGYYTTRIGTITIGSTSWSWSVTTIQNGIPVYTRNNDSFIDKSFWNSNPSTWAIINAIYGDGLSGNDATAYTKVWTWLCNIRSIKVQFLQNFDTSGLDSIPANLAANTIYVLSPGRYIVSDTVNFSGNCTTIIGQNSPIIYSKQKLATSAIFKSSGKDNLILSNIKIDWAGDGSGNQRGSGDISTGGNNFGINLYNGNNATISQVHAYNSKFWVEIQQEMNVLITDSTTYNNYNNGLYFYSALNSYINNCQSFNNISAGISLSRSSRITVNNSQIYNNALNGIVIDSGEKNVISNSQLYSNLFGWVNFKTNSSNNILYNLQLYNNNAYGVTSTTWSVNNKYYGTIKVYGNNKNASGDNNLQASGMIVGNTTDSEVSWLNWANGSLDIGGNITYAYITNPISNWVALISGNNRTGNLRGTIASTGIFTNFIYGTGILKQTSPLAYTWTSITVNNSINYDTNKYIAQLSISTDPNGFSFLPVTGANLNQLYTSSIITINGMETGYNTTYTFNWRGTLYKNGAIAWASGTGNNGDQFYITMNASANYYTIRYATFQAGIISSVFSVTTKHDPSYNDNPAVFSFIDLTGAIPNQLYTSNIITISWMSTGASNIININWAINTIYKNGMNIGATGTGANGDQIYFGMNASNDYLTSISWSISIGTAAAVWNVTTMIKPTTDPNPFIFTAITWAQLNQLYTSNTITFSWMSEGIIADVILNGQGNIYKNEVNIGTGGTGSNGDQFYIAITGSSTYISTTTGILVAGNTSAGFSVTTKQDITPPVFSWASSGVNSSGTVTIVYRDDNLSGATLNGNPYSSGTPITWEGDYVFMAYDTAGNSTGANFSIIYPKTIIVTFDRSLSTGIVTKAPLKYNKDAAYSFTYDDGINDGYDPVFKYSEGGQISWRDNHFVAPGIYYTDGAGNDVAFKWAYAWVSANRLMADSHTDASSGGSITWPQLRETYLNGWDILNHSWRHMSFVDTGVIYEYPDNPPGTTGIDYAYEITKNDEAVRNSIGVSWVHLTHFVAPAWDPNYEAYARQLGYKSMAHQQYTDGFSGLNVYPDANIYHLKMYRKYVTADDFGTWNIGDDIDFLMANSATPTTRLWRQASTHVVVLTGSNQGGLDFWLRRYLMDHIANNYGKNWSDKMRVAWSQEVYEYLATKQSTNINNNNNGNQMIISLDIANIPRDQRRNSLTLLVTGGNAHITNIQYQTWGFTYHSENKESGLINIEMGEYFLNDKDPNTFQLNNITWAIRNQLYTSNIVSITGMSPGLDNIIYLSGSTSSLYKNGTNIGTQGTGANGDQFYIAMTGSNAYTTTKTAQLLIGPESSTFTLLTQDDLDPDQFTFNSITWATLNQLYTSNIITLTGMTNGVNNTINISGRGTLYKNGVNIGTSGTGTNGDLFYIAINASSGYYTTRIGTVTIGTTSWSRSITTLPNLNPNTFSFTPVNGATRNQIYTSNIITITGITSGFSNTISLIWSGTLYKNGVNIWTSGTGANGDLFFITMTSSPNFIETYTGNLSIGTASASRAITTTANNNPTQFNFISLTWVTRNQLYTSNIITLAGMTNGQSNVISITWSGTLYKNGFNVWTSSTWANGDLFYIAMTGSTNYYETYASTVTIGTTSWSRSITTLANLNPNTFNFISLTWATRNQLYTSNIITLAWMTNGFSNTISIIWSGTLYKNGISIGTSGTGANGDLFYIAMTGSANYYETYAITVTIGTTSASWSITTLPNLNPNTFSFTSLTGATRNQLYTSNIITLAGMTNGFSNTISITWSGSLFKNGVNIWTSGTGANGDLFIIKTTSSSNYYETYTGTVSIWTTSASWSITTLANLNPNAFSFTAITGGTRNQLYTSNIITLAGMTNGQSNVISITWSGTLYKNGFNVWTSSTWANGDLFYIAMTGSANYYEIYASTVTIGTTSASWSITTLANLNPNAFNFTAITWTTRNQLYTSNIITLAGMTNGFSNAISIAWSGTLYKNGISIGTSGTGTNGDLFYISLTSSSNFLQTRTGTVSIGTTSASRAVTTSQDNIAPIGSFTINSGAQYTNTGSIWLTNITWSDDSYPLQVRFSNDKSSRSSRTGIGGNNNWTLSWNNWIQIVYAQLKDALGNVSTGDILGTIILDTLTPNYSGVVDNQTYTTTVQIRYNDTNISWASLNGSPYSSGTPITANNTYTLIISDLAGNTTTVHFQIINNNPSPFSFTAITWATRNQLYTSNTITLTWMSAGSANTVILSWNGILYKNNVNIWISGTGGNGDQLYIAITGSSSFSTSKTGTLSVGNQYADFTVTTQWDVFAPTGGSFVISNGALYTRNALVSIDNITGIDDTYPLQIRFSNDNTNRWSWMAMASTKSRTLSSGDGNKTVYMQIQDAIGNTTTWTISDSIILDTTAPSYSGVNNQWIYSGNVSVQYNDTNISWATLNGSPYSSGTPITQEGSYTLIISDLAGNSTTITFSIDKNVQGTISYSPVWPQWTSGNVTMSITGIGEGIYVTNNGGSSNYIFTNNGSFTYTFRDNVGNTNSLSGSVNWIDKQGPISPTLVFPIDTNHYGASAITLQRNAATDSPGGIGTVWGYFYNIQKNGVLYSTGNTVGTSQEIANLPDGTYTWKVVAYDGLGNQWARSDEHSFIIDTQLPSATIVYLPGSGQWTSGNVVANITGFNKTMAYINTWSYVFNTNGSFTFTFQDEAGNSWEALANVRWIDKTAPGIPSISNLIAGQKINPHLTSLQIQAGAYTGAPIANYEYEVSTTSNMNNIVDRWNSSINTFSLQESNEGSYYIKTRVSDVAGNYSSRSDAIHFTIDTTNPTATVTYSPDSWPITGNVTATIGNTSEVITGLNQTGYTFIQNGSFTFTFQDEAGNTGEVLASVDWIQTDRVILIQTGNAVDMFIKNGYTENTGAGSFLFSPQEMQTGTTVIGNLPIVFDQYATIPTQVILQSAVDSWSTWDQTNQIAEIKIPGNTVITSGWVSCDQTLFAPTFAGKDIAQANLTHENIYSSIKAGMSCLNSSTLFKTAQQADQNITIKIKDESIPNGTVKIWYSTNANDWTYLSTAVANNGIVSFSTTHLTYFAIGTDKPVSPSQWGWGGWGGGGWGGGGWGWGNTSTPTNNQTITDVIKDIFNGTTTWAQETPQTRQCSIKASPYSTEINNAYIGACEIGITTMPTIQTANIDGKVIRSQLAKMISNYIIATKWTQIQSDRVCNFSDMKDQTEEMKYYAIMACKLGVMWVGTNGKGLKVFSPNQEVSRAQFGTVLSRVLRGNTYISPVNRPYYENHLAALKNFQIMNQITNPENRMETRGNIMIMLMRAISKVK